MPNIICIICIPHIFCGGEFVLSADILVAGIIGQRKFIVLIKLKVILVIVVTIWEDNDTCQFAIG